MGSALRLAGALAPALVALGCDGGRGPVPADGADGQGPALVVSEVLGGAPDDSLFARVGGPRDFVFPADHGPHPDHRSEWWYVTANLEAADGRVFGVQFTLFRRALAPELGEPSASVWDTRQVYLGHVALTDVAAGRHYPAERFARGAAGLAGAQAEPFRVWLEDWRLASADADWRLENADAVDPAIGGAAGGAAARGPAGAPVLPAPDDPDAIFPLRIQASEGGFAFDLLLEAGRGMVLQGEGGYSRKGADPGNASHYYSYPRMPARGTVRVGGETLRVSGLAWLDREWSTSALDQGQVGWDWFALQLDDGTDLMVYQLRRADGSPDAPSRGLLVTSDGATRSLTPSDWSLEVLERWASPIDGASYPARWRLRVPAAGLDLDIQPRVADQEMDVSVRYWEGAASVRGTGPSGPLTGRGYVELTGYADGAGGGAPAGRRSPR